MADLQQVGFLNGVIRGCIVDPTLGTPEAHPNAPLFGEVEWYLTCRQIAHAGDTFNTYCQRILAEILEADMSHFDTVAKHLQNKSDPAAAIHKLKIQRQTDNNVREALRDTLSVTWCNEVEIICELRNKVVHQCGLDPEGKVAARAEEYPPGEFFLYPTDLDPALYPVDCAPDGKLLIDARAAHWATRWVQHIIHLMDQNICTRFGVSQARQKPPSSSFHMSAKSATRPFHPGVPLPQAPSQTKAHPSPPLPELPELEPMATPEEKSCAQTWHKLRAELDTLVRTSCEESNTQIGAMECNLAGHPLPHTLVNHEIHISYTLSSPDSSNLTPNTLGIRIRQKNFQPYVTVWSTKTMMKDFDPTSHRSELEEEIVTAIHTIR